MDRMNVVISVQANNIGQKRANVRSSLLVSNLLTTIKDKFNLDGNFELRLDNSRRALPQDVELDAAGVRDGSQLVVAQVIEATGTVDAIARGVRERLSKNFTRVYLVEERTLFEYDLPFQPAVIGRRDHQNPSRNRLLVADLEDLEGSQTVSRHHAAISESGGSFFLESINPYNPTYLGDMRLRMGVLYPLPAGSRVRAGQVVLTFHIIG